MKSNRRGDVGVVKVILRRDAWAKSHRPIRSLFKVDRIRLVGGGDLGQMYFEERDRSCCALSREISLPSAENSTNLKLDLKTGKMVPPPIERAKRSRSDRPN